MPNLNSSGSKETLALFPDTKYFGAQHRKTSSPADLNSLPLD